MNSNPWPLVAWLGGMTLRRFLLGTAAAGAAYVIGKGSYEAGKFLEGAGEGIKPVIPFLTYSIAGIMVYNIARKGKPF